MVFYEVLLYRVKLRPNKQSNARQILLCVSIEESRLALPPLLWYLHRKSEAIPLGLSRGKDDLERRGLVAEKKARERRHPNYP